MDVDGIASVQAWSPDGSQIAVTGGNLEEGIKEDGVWLIDIHTHKTTYLRTGDAATWSPDGKQIAIYSCEKENRVARLYLLELSSMERTKVYNNGPCTAYSDLAWSPDGKTLAFTYGDPLENPENFNPVYPDQIFLIDVTSGQIMRFTEKGYRSPSWTPDNKSMAFVRNSDLIISETTGSCVKEIDYLMPGISKASLSPDGTKFAVSALGGYYVFDISIVKGKGYLESSCR